MTAWLPNWSPGGWVLRGGLLVALLVTGCSEGCQPASPPPLSLPARRVPPPVLSSPAPSPTPLDLGTESVTDPESIASSDGVRQRIPTPPIVPDWEPAADADDREWKHIVLHHTATETGSVDNIHEAHLGRGWQGIGYHFVIGNGDGMPNGLVEPTFRWRTQIQGAHAGKREYNEHGIGICLVGNFENDPPTDAQLKSVKRLVRHLREVHNIPASRVIPHGDIKATACPGKLFPLEAVRDSSEPDNRSTSLTRPISPRFGFLRHTPLPSAPARKGSPS